MLPVSGAEQLKTSDAQWMRPISSAHSAYSRFVSLAPVKTKPSSASPCSLRGGMNRGNVKTDPEWAKTLEPGWQERRMNNFEDCLFNPVGTSEDLVADFLTMRGNWDRVDEIVADKTTAEALKAYYNVNCKRPTFHDEYLQSFNKPNVTLVNTEGRGVESVQPKGVVVGGKLFEVDIIFATGFEVFSPTCVTGEYTVTGAGGRSLQEKWSERFSTLHGMLTHGFPDMEILKTWRNGDGVERDIEFVEK
jgi:cyclohexanone monooxygenase